MAIIIIRVIPEKPTTGENFTDFLNGLTITAFDISFENPEGVNIGQASYLAPENPPPLPQNPNPDTGIVQHFVIINPDEPLPTWIPQAVATAIIEVDNQPEYKTSDILFEITRDGNEIIHKQVYYNVQVVEGELPEPGQFQEGQDTTSIYLSLPVPSHELDPDDAHVDMPEDGTPLKYEPLRNAVLTVLNEDPGAGNFDLTSLSSQQSLHIAKEIIFIESLPKPSRSLDRLYTEPINEDEERDRNRFEAELQSYYAIHNITAERLANFVFALSTAEANSAVINNDVSEAGLDVPVQITETDGKAKIKTVKIILTTTEAVLVPSFAVSAVYWYALGMMMSRQTTSEQRYLLATLSSEKEILDQITRAIDGGVIEEPADVKRHQAARRLVELGATLGSAPKCEITDVQDLVQAWLDFTGEEIATFWESAVGEEADGPHASGHLDLVLCALTGDHQPLIDAVEEELNITSVKELAAVTASQWRTLFFPEDKPPRFHLIPNSLHLQGTAEERVASFISYIGKFFNVSYASEAQEIEKLKPPPTLHRSLNDPFRLFADEYHTLSGGNDFVFGSGLDNFAMDAINEVFPDDGKARAWLEEALRTIDELWVLTDIVFPLEAPPTDPQFLGLRYAILEALFARGFTLSADIANLTLSDFRQSLIGTVAYDFANLLHANAEPGPPPGQNNGDEEFSPINTDGCLVNCIPPMYLSPLGPVAYLHEMLRLSEGSTCEEPFPPIDTVVIDGVVVSGGRISDHIAGRCGPLGDLLVTRANLDIQLPWIDLVNECLEALASTAPEPPPEVVHNTAGEELAGHILCEHGKDPDPEEFCHVPTTLSDVLPALSSPATPVAAPDAYVHLRNDFTHSKLPYSQPLDINRTYLQALRTNRYETMRTFHEQTSEFVLNPENPPLEFEGYRWREPVREEIAIEYLDINPEELEILFKNDIDNADLPAFYGFPSAEINGESWLDIVVRLDEFLKPTCLTYCEFLELWRSEFVFFVSAVSDDGSSDENFPDCEPCDLNTFVIEFIVPEDREDALRKLIVFIRLWRILKKVEGAGYSFVELRDICVVLGLFNADGTINLLFIRWLYAFQRSRDMLQLPLFDENDPPLPNARGAERMHLLALTDPGDPKFAWALDLMLDLLQPYAQMAYKCPYKLPHFLKLLIENMDALSVLAGFNPDNPLDRWNTRWPNILRMIEVLGKIYASQFSVGQLLFLFTADEHLHEADLPQLQPLNEALCRPFDLPDDSPPGLSLWNLRDKLLAVTITDEVISSYTWTRIVSILQDEFQYQVPESTTDHLHSFGSHFIPGVLENEGISVSLEEKQYRTELANTSEPMWNTPSGGPFNYDPQAEKLWINIALTDESVIWKLGRVRNLDFSERMAVRKLYIAPRTDLCSLSFLFPNMGEADEALIQESDEQKRWKYFQKSFALFYARCKIITEYLAENVVKVTGRTPTEDINLLSWQVLRHLWADENFAKSTWEVDSGEVPEVTWGPQPHGGAFAALIGLVGTGLLGTYRRGTDAPIAWQEMRGPAEAFGDAKNAMNVPIPTVLPPLDYQLKEEQQRFLGSRNGIGIDRTSKVIGGLEEYIYVLRGLLLVENEGEYKFSFELEYEETKKDAKWFVRLQQGQKIWSVLVKDWPSEEGPEYCSAPLSLKRSVYEIEIHFYRKPLVPLEPEDACPQRTGFMIKYCGPDTENEWIVPPHKRLFIGVKDGPLKQEETTDPDLSILAPLSACYVPTIRDIMCTFLRSLKALLCAYNQDLSPKSVTDSRQSEFDFFPSHPDHFPGVSYFRQNGGFGTHHVHYNFNFLPVLQHFHPHDPDQDLRAQPTLERKQGLFDLFFEALFDYTRVREEASEAREAPAVNALHEWLEGHTDPIAHGCRHLGIDLFHKNLVLRYFDGIELTGGDDLSSTNLVNFHWLFRVWQAERWIRSVETYFFPKEIRELRPDLVSSTDPGVIPLGESESGNVNITAFYRAGCIENGEPRRYSEIGDLNNRLRKNAREALIFYLIGMNRVELPWGGFAETAADLSDLLLMDVNVGICQKASRIEAAISKIHSFIQRARLGLEPDFSPTEAFTLLWDSHFKYFYTWEACKRREIYRENWIAWKKQEEARRSEAYRFLEKELRNATLTIPVPGGLEYWTDKERPKHPGIVLLQKSEPSHLHRFEPTIEGLGLHGLPERDARHSWLSPFPSEREGLEEGVGPPDETLTGDESLSKLPLWIQAAIRMSTNFIRVAAAGEPQAVTEFVPRTAHSETSCCVECSKPHPPNIDEYYFWTIESCHITEKELEQDADWGISDEEEGVDNLLSDWHRPERLPGLLYCNSEPMVHLVWCCIRNGECQQLRRSHEGVRINPDADDKPRLVFVGRRADSLIFEIKQGEAPIGFPAPPPPGEDEQPAHAPGFRYDIKSDMAVVLPEIALAEPEGDFIGGLPAYPYCVYFMPGAPLFPTSLFSPILAIAAHLRAHCRFEAALKWYACFLDPLKTDLSEIWCIPDTEPPAQPAPDPDLLLISDDLAEKRATILHYLETLLQWTDALLRKNTLEASKQARVIVSTAARILGEHPKSIIVEDPTEEPKTVTNFEPLEAPISPRLLAVYDQVNDRLDLIHNCLNAYRLPNGHPKKQIPYWGNNPQRKDWLSLVPNCYGEQVTPQSCLDDADWCCPSSAYRFEFLVKKAIELANEVRGLGSALLSAFEKGDAEYLGSLRATHELQLQNLTLDIRKNQWREADWQEQALEKSKEIAQTRLRYFETLIENGLIGGEVAYETLTGVSLGLKEAARASEFVAQFMGTTQDHWVGIPIPWSLDQIPVGSKLAGVFATISRIANSFADTATTSASLALTKAGWDRREDEWEHQVEVLKIEIDQIERQILAANRRKDIALRELNNHKRQIENSTEILDVLRDKFTNHALYLWLQRELAALYYRMYELAMCTARQAQRAFNFECGHTQRNFLSVDIWDNLHEGLTAGESLDIALREMEKAYLDKNLREYELTTHFSLLCKFPLEFLKLLITGSCIIEIPEWMFDHDYPGHYMRRIKNVSLSIPCVTGPYTTIHCRLTLLSSTTRVDPYLIEQPADCCNDDKKGNSYEPQPDDARIFKQYTATDAIATSSGLNDAGMFELNFRDERYLPFEYRGAVSCWLIELPEKSNYFNIKSVSDVIMHLNYTAREGGEVLRNAALEVAQKYLPGNGWRLFEIDKEFPQAWHQFQSQISDGKLDVRLKRNMFPFLPCQPDVMVNNLYLFIEAPGAEPSAYRQVEFLAGNSEGYEDKRKKWMKCDLEYIPCIATDKWPKLFFGVHMEQFGKLAAEGELTLGTFKFPQNKGPVTRIYMLVGYDVLQTDL